MVTEYLEDVKVNLEAGLNFGPKEIINNYLNNYNLVNIKNNPQKLLEAVDKFRRLEDIYGPIPFNKKILNQIKESEEYIEFTKKNLEFLKFPEVMIKFSELNEEGINIYKQGNQHLYMHSKKNIVDIDQRIVELDLIVADSISKIASEKINEFPFMYPYDETDLEKHIIDDFFKGNISAYNRLMEFDTKSDKYIKDKFSVNSYSSKEIKKIGTVKQFLFTAEWIWRNSEFIRNNQPKFAGIDMSYQVASYFKAIELLLCKKVGIISETCKYIVNKSNQYIPNEKKVIGNASFYLKSTLGDYHFFIKSYVLIQDKYPNAYPSEKDPIRDNLNRQSFVEECITWTNKHRNALQHRDSANDGEHVYLIREASKNLINSIITHLKD